MFLVPPYKRSSYCAFALFAACSSDRNHFHLLCLMSSLMLGLECAFNMQIKPLSYAGEILFYLGFFFTRVEGFDNAHPS